MSLYNSTQREALSTKTTKAANIHERNGRNFTASGAPVTIAQLATTLGLTVAKLIDTTAPIVTDGGEWHPTTKTKQSWQLYTVGGYPANPGL